MSAVTAGCGSNAPPPPAPVPPMQATTDVFAQDVLHYVELEVAPEHLPTLVPFGEERVPARLVYDGVALADVGLRLKGGFGSARPLGEKASFSLKTHEFVSGQKLHGVRRFTLDSELQDEGLVSAHLGYEVFRRAGLPARRSAFARVVFNGVYYGVYLVAEGIDKDFVKRWFADPDGNLYEGESTDVTVPEDMELETNEEANDRSDLEALRDVLASADDAALLATLPQHVDVDAFYRYWACEAVCNHWDGYVGLDRTIPAHLEPNNYYVYVDPARGLVWIPHGIDQLFDRPTASVLGAPIEAAVLPSRLHATAEGRARLVAAIREVLAGAWDVGALLARLDAVEPLIEGSVECPTPGSPTLGDWRAAVGRIRSFLSQRARWVLGELAEDAAR